MRVEENENYTVLLNPNDMAALVAGNSVTFWIIHNDDDVTFKIKKDE